MLLESNNFERAKSIVSTPPYVQSTLSVALRSEFEPPVASVVTIIDDTPISGSDSTFGGDYYLGANITITWSCIPPSEVTVELYGANLSFSHPFQPTGDYTVRETIITSNTSYSFNTYPYGWANVHQGELIGGTSMYVVITPSIGSPVTGRTVSVITGY
jgi:hypothetical protein